jgi:hypothetical protein
MWRVLLEKAVYKTVQLLNENRVVMKKILHLAPAA